MSHRLLLGGQQSIRSPFTMFAANSSTSRFHHGSYSSRSMCNLGGITSLSLCGSNKSGPCGGGGLKVQRRYSIHEVNVDPSLQEPFHVSICPEIGKVKRLEMEQMKNLNSKFADFIDKVQCLEQKNQVLATKWSLLQKQDKAPSRSLEPLFEQFINSLKKQLDCLLCEKTKLEADQESTKELTEDFKSRYEKKVDQRVAAENDFAGLKKDMDCVNLTNAELESKVSLLCEEIQFLRYLYMKERERRDKQGGDLDVVVKIDNSRSLDMDNIIAAIRKEYEEVVQRSKAEADAFYQTKYQEAQNQKGNFKGGLKKCEQQISELTKKIERLQCEIQSVQKENEELQKAVCDATEGGDSALKDARQKYAELAEALRNGKDELACLLRDYQELLNVKIALDIEIAAYKRLLEGEEDRISRDRSNSVSISVSSASKSSQSAEKPRKECESSTKDVDARGSGTTLSPFKYTKNRCQGERHSTDYRKSCKTKGK